MMTPVPTPTPVYHVVFGSGKVRHLVASLHDEDDRVETFCRMFYRSQGDKVRVVDPDDERTNRLPLCGACLRTPKAKLTFGGTS